MIRRECLCSVIFCLMPKMTSGKRLGFTVKRIFLCLVVFLLLSFLIFGHRGIPAKNVREFIFRSDPNKTSKFEDTKALKTRFLLFTTSPSHSSTTFKKQAIVAKPTKPSNSTDKNASHSLCVHFMGGIGNQMFHYATVYGIARQKNMSVIIDAKSRISKVFANITANKVNDMSECNSFKFIIESLECGFSKNLLDITNTRNYRLGRTLQSWMYFHAVDKEIKSQFIFNADIKKKARDYFQHHLSKHKVNVSRNVTFIGVHVRRGDKTSKAQSHHGFRVADRHYFIEAFDFMRRTFGNVLFIVTSDDKEWVKTNIMVNNVTLLEGRNWAEVDMAILTLCNHTIISVGTFGWWIAYLTGGLTIYYKNHVREGSNLRKVFSADMKDYFYPGWIGLE